MFGHVAEVNYAFYCCCCHGIISVVAARRGIGCFGLVLEFTQDILIVYTTFTVESNYIYVLLVNDCLHMDVPFRPVCIRLF